MRDPVASEIQSSKKRALSRNHVRNLQTEQELTKARDELNQFRDLYIRQRAEMENFVKAKEREVAQIMKNANKGVIKDLLPIVDSLESAVANSQGDKNMEAMRNQVVKMLEGYGLSTIEAKGKKFDPFLYEAVAISESDEDGIVLEEVQKGYQLNGEVIRTSKVIVGKRGE